MDTFTYTAVCQDCGALLNVPKFFLSTELKCLFGLVAAFLEFIIIVLAAQKNDPTKWFIIGQSFVAIITVIIVRSISTAVLSFGQWEEQQPMNDVLLRYYNDPKGHKQRTFIIILISLHMAMNCLYGLFFYLLFGLMLALVNVLIGIIAKKKNNLKVGLLVILGASILFIGHSITRSNVVKFIITGIGFFLCFFAFYFMCKYFDNRKKKTQYS